ncbi:MAG: type IX secretion system membrane protein PorP/SprF, partial [Bacteroidota bacterium]
MLRIAAFFLCLSVFAPSFGQALRFDQPSNTPLYLNPGFTGTQNRARLAMTFRRQWVGIPGAPISGYISYDQLSDRLRGGWGFIAVAERYGPWWMTAGYGCYSLKLTPFKGVTIAPSIKAGIVYQRL